MPSLLESKKEINYGASQFSSKTFLFKDATKQNFINNTKGNTILHLASHSNASDTNNPWIAFYDAKLTLDELYLTQNSADLVVLSACETSLGKLNQGEGVMSLARGFFNTGTNSVLSTLWNVNDKSSSKIITNFYKYVKKGKTKSEALRLAKLNYLKTHQLSELSPYYWSSFILIGDANHLSIQSNNTLLYSTLALFILLFISYLAYRKQKQ
jgi:CHAT domain-containing protein